MHGYIQHRVAKQVFETPGFSSELSLDQSELILFRDLVEKHWLDVIRREVPDLAPKFSEVGIGRYHEIANLIEHNKIWHKSNRILPQPSVKIIKSMPFIKELRSIFGNFDISDGVYDNTALSDQEEIYWRIVRPNVETDVGPIHADKWFHAIQSLTVRGESRKSSRSIKLWLPLFCDAGKSGLKLAPDSHRRDWNYRVVDRCGIPRLEFLEDVQPILIPTVPGNFLLFNDSTLHAGALNISNETRISAEITMVLSDVDG